MYLQVATKHFFSSCIYICFQVVIYKLLQVDTRCLCVTICLQVVTRCIYKLLQCTSSSCINTFGNDVARRKNRVKSNIIYYSQHAGKDLSFFQGNEASLKWHKFASQGYFQQQDKALFEASYETAFAIAKQTKPNSIGETLMKPCAIAMVKIVLEETCVKKIDQISLSDDTVKRRIGIFCRKPRLKKVIHKNPH